MIDFLDGLRKICDKHNILLICDEVQSGFGRTGKMFAVEHFGVEPNILVMAKGIASGYPLSAIVSRKEIMDLQPAGSMGGTYSGNAIACAAAKATLQIFEDISYGMRDTLGLWLRPDIESSLQASIILARAPSSNLFSIPKCVKYDPVPPLQVHLEFSVPRCTLRSAKRLTPSSGLRTVARVMD